MYVCVHVCAFSPWSLLKDFCTMNQPSYSVYLPAFIHYRSAECNLTYFFTVFIKSTDRLSPKWESSLFANPRSYHHFILDVNTSRVVEVSFHAFFATSSRRQDGDSFKHHEYGSAKNTEPAAVAILLYRLCPPCV